MPRICVFGYTHPVDDKRVFRTVESLGKKHKIFYVYRVEENKRQSEHDLKQMYPDVKFIGIPLERKDFRDPIKRLKFDRKVLQTLRNVAQQVDLVYVHDWIRTHPKEPFWSIRKMDKRIIYDVHEYYPESTLEKLPAFLLPSKRALCRSVLNRQLSMVDGAIFVSNAQKRCCESNALPPSTIIPNVATFSLDIFDKKQRESVFTVVGGTSRDITDVFPLMKAIRLQGLKVKLRVVGMPCQSSSDYCEVFPFQPYGEMMKLIQNSFYSLMIFRTHKLPSLNDVVRLPNKFFDSLAAGTPVIVDEFFEEMSRLTLEWGVGLVVDMRDPEAAANKIISSLEDGSYEKFLRNIDRHKAKFTWQTYEQHFLRFVDAILEGRA